MNILDDIKNKILNLYETNQRIHINIYEKKRKILKNEPALIKGVYPHVFQIEVTKEGSSMCYTFQYTDLLMRNIEIKD